jgi:hypothetical protein
MKTKYYLLIILLFTIFSLVIPSFSYSQITFGLNGGLTYNGLTGDAPEDASYKRKIDYTLGAHFEYKITKDIILGIGTGYYRTGTIVTYDIGEKETKDSFNISISYINIPVTFKVLTGGKHTYFSSGLDYRMLLNANLKYLESSSPDKDIKEQMNSYDLAIFAGFGGLITFGMPSIGLELRYSHSLMNISKDDVNNRSGTPRRFRFTGFQFLVSFNYSLK